MYKSRKFSEEEIKNALKLLENDSYGVAEKKTGISARTLKRIADAEGNNLTSFYEQCKLWDSIIGSIRLSSGKFWGHQTIKMCKEIVQDDIRRAMEEGKRLENMNENLISIWNEAL